MNKITLSKLHIGIASLGLIAINEGAVLAQVTADDTVNTQVSQDGNISEITGGETRGNNLFHSFQDFSVNAGNEAFFNNATDVGNIFSRVTGGNISNIDGAIRANGSANLFLINPAGIIFGEGSSLDIGGSFYGSSASSILFEDGEFSAADLENPPLLTVNAPIGLGFRDNPGDIVNRSNFGLTTTILDSQTNTVFENAVFEGREFTLREVTGLEVNEDQTIALLGGNVTIENGAGVTALGANVELGGLSQAGDISLNGDGSLTFPERVSRGDVTLDQKSRVQVASDGGGSININARNFELREESQLYAGIAEGVGTLEAQAGNIIINATESARLIGETRQTPFDFSLPLIDLLDIERENSAGVRNTVGISSILRNDGSSQSSAEGNSGNVIINSPILELSQVGVIDTSVFGTGNGGDIIINAEDSVVLNQGVLLSQIRGFDEEVVRESGNGNAGDVSINTGSLLLTDIAFILADVRQGATGNGGDVTIQVADNFTQNQDSFILTQLGQENIGSAGDISITAGSYEIGERTILPALQSDSSPDSEGDAGNVTINVENNFAITNNLILAQIQSGSMGNAGEISISANNISIDEFAIVSSNAGSDSIGTAGNVTLNANNNISVSNGAVIDALTENEFDGGDITINAQNLDLLSGGKVVTGSENIGDAGNINLNIRENLVINNQNPPNDSPFDESILQNIELQTGLFANTFPGSTSNGGNISITAKSIDLQDQGSILAETTSGSGGNINLIVDETIRLRNNSLISAQAFNDANGGNLFIDTDFIIAFPEGNNDIIASASEGNGGNITINAESLFGIRDRPLNDSTNDINASSEFSLDGTISINTPDLNPIQGTTELPRNVVQSEETTAQACRADSETSASNQLIVSGRGGIAPTPGNALDSANVMIDGEVADSTAMIQPLETSQGKVQPARGIKVMKSGEVVLTSYTTDNAGNRVPSVRRNCKV